MKCFHTGKPAGRQRRYIERCAGSTMHSGMYSTTLVSHAIEEGERLLETLKRERFQVFAAVWYRVPDSSRWVLAISTPVVARKGPTAAYTRLQRILLELKPEHLSLSNISLFSPSEFERVRSTVGLPNQFGVRPVTGRARTLSSFEDAYVYGL